MNYKEFSLNEVAEFQKGFAFKSKDYQSSGKYIVKVSNLTYDSIDLSNCVCIDEQKANDYLKYQLLEGDIIITTVGSWPSNPASVVGKVVNVPKEADNTLLNQNAVRVRAKDNISQQYLYYLLRNVDFKNYIIGTAQGSANQASITQADIKNYVFKLPSKDVQDRVAMFLSTLDAKINVNNNLNQTLESITQETFKHWFVNFEFPNENGEPYKSSGGKFVESELGLIPEGWKVQPISELTNVSIGKTPPRKEKHWFSEDPKDIRWVSIKDMGNSGVYINKASEYLTSEAINKFNVKIIPDNTVILSFKLTIGRIAITIGEMLSNEAIAQFDNTDSVLSTEYLFSYLKNFNFNSLGNTSSIATAINSKIVKAIPVLVPSEEILYELQDVVEPIFSLIKSNILQMENLTELRDTLLPKLMSGEIHIPEAEQEVETCLQKTN